VRLLGRPFTPLVEVTASLKLKRDVITEAFKKEIVSLFG
jgi:hypothetical protein